MTKEKLFDTLKIINFDKSYFDFLESCSSFDVVFTKETNIYKITINLDMPLSCHVYMQLKAAFETYFKSKIESIKVGLFIKLTKPCVDSILLKDYINYYVDHIVKNPDEYQFIKKQSISIRNNEISIKYDNVFVEDKLNEIKPNLEKYIRAVGFSNASLKYIYIEPETFDYEHDSLEYEKLQKEYLEQKKLEENHKPATGGFEKKSFSRPSFTNKTFTPCELDEIPENIVDVEVKVKVFDVVAEGKSGKRYKMNLTNYKASYSAHIWTNKNVTAKQVEDTLNKWILLRGTLSYSQFDKENSFEVYNFDVLDYKEEEIMDDSEVKRVELHAHTNMSAMDGIADPTDLINTAARWGHKAIAITDHVAVQSYPAAQNAQKALKKKGIDIKILYGLELNVAPRALDIVNNPTNISLKNASYVFFDLETSGLSCEFDKIIEFGAVKIENGVEVDRKDILINPGFNVSNFTTSLTHITNDMLANKKKIEEVIDEIKDFIGSSILVAHNASFDIGFLEHALGYKLSNPTIDTLPLCRYLYQEEKRYTLGAMCRLHGIDYDEESAHRGDYDAEVLRDLYDVLLGKLVNENIALTHADLEKLESPDVTRKMHPYHANLLATTPEGVKNIYKILSIANTDYFTAQALVPPHVINEHREGIIIGSSCARGEIFELASTKSKEKVIEAMKWYDYIEIQPLDQYQILVDTEKVESMDKIKKILNFMIECANEANIKVCATGDLHYVRKEQHIAREVFISIPAIGGGFHPLYDGKNRIKEYPIQEFKTTNQMLEAFEWLGKDKAYEYVITNPNMIADMVEDIKPIKEGTYPPHLDNVENELRDRCYAKAHKWYGDNIPSIVTDRLEKELSLIIDKGYSIMYALAYKCVEDSNQRGFLVGSRGSVGSSFTATMSGITEVNPLPPHYRCPKCGYSDFDVDKSYRSGFDLPDKPCPCCGETLIGDGHNIPFETFLGFHGEKVPDIDLNFSALNQGDAHAYIRNLFGYDHVYRAGTIATAASKTAFGYAKKYFEKQGKEISNAEAARIAKMCEGVKRTTGQHPGGIIVIPTEMDVFDFTPVGYPADDTEADWKTTHMDYHAIHDNVLKLDMLGHVDPTALRMLHTITGLNPLDIPMNKQEVINLFNGDNMFEDITHLTAVGLPEFGTTVARKMLIDTKPKQFADLTAISGLAHGTDVFFGNEKELFTSGVLSIQKCIGCRDDIMVDLINYGLESTDAFAIMEFVRKGKPSADPEKWAKYVDMMKEHNVDQWYIDVCTKIKYMFPKAHAVAYCLMAYRIAYYKLYYPLEFYATYFTTRSDAFDIEAMIAGIDELKKRYFEIEAKIANNEKLLKKEEDLDTFYEVAIEMYQRGYKFTNIDLERSDDNDFVCDKENNAIIPPFRVLDGLGGAAAQSVVKARKDGPFLSRDDLASRTKLNNTNLKLLEKLGVIDKLSETAQLTLFNF